MGVYLVRKERAEKTGRRIFRLFLFLLPLITACSAAPVVKVEPSASGRSLARVPFYPQDAYQCGPSSLAAVLNFHGADVTPVQIAAEIFSPTARGTLDLDLVYYAEGKGFKVRRYAGSEEDVKKNIDQGNPLIALVDHGRWVYEKGHFLVIIGYNSQGFIVNSGNDRLLFLPRDEFLTIWKKAGFITLLIERR